MAAIELTVNGLKRHMDADPDSALLYVLRNDLDCKGVRFGCGTGHCGACTVLVDGRAMQSCDMSLSAAVGREVITAEYLPHNGVGAIVRETFLEQQAAQCGYCINGIMMSVTALLSRTLEPSRDEMNLMLHRHLCRCGTHQRIVGAIHSAASRLRADAKS